ncbi:MAG: hypothetical protein HY360_10330 [Verrucomicrobia bacterium]|nr:hypothetical protein [Verrucomicrobiota bacterium]
MNSYDSPYPAIWTWLVEKHAEMLMGIAVEDVPVLLNRDAETFAARVGQGMEGASTAAERKERVMAVLGAAMALTLHRQGWMLVSPVGEPVAFRNGDITIKPFADIRELAAGTMSLESWRERCREVWLRRLPPDQVIVFDRVRMENGVFIEDGIFCWSGPTGRRRWKASAIETIEAAVGGRVEAAPASDPARSSPPRRDLPSPATEMDRLRRDARRLEHDHGRSGREG